MGSPGVLPQYVTVLCAAPLAAAILMPDTSRSVYTSKAKKRCRHAAGRNGVQPDADDRSPDDEAPLEANLAVAIVGCRDPDDWYKRQERIDPLQRVFGVVEGMQH